ncbi:MAG: hypothetical protein KC983_09150 [Phycisphaerales bacterium]|nr:hypothetical protein [Phycisphaerales bacterium]
MTRARANLSTVMLLLMAVAIVTALTGCESAPRNLSAIRAYYNYDFTTAREGLRADTYARIDDQTLLNQGRLGLASLADGDLDEAERNLGAAFDLLSTAGLNEDRTVAAVLSHEGARIWKGEPFEQALLYYYTSLIYAMRGDWENMRAASANALFRLTDFGAERNKEQLARDAARTDTDPGDMYTAVDTDFALGLLMQAIGTDLSGLGGADRIFDDVATLRPNLEATINTLRSRDYDTLLVVEYGKGPTKIAYGPDNALSRFEPQEYGKASLSVDVAGSHAVTIAPICAVDDMARDLRWNNFEDVRVAKSVLGDVLIVGGAIVAGSATEYERRPGRGYRSNVNADTDWGQVAAGVGMMLAGALAKSGAQADTRYLEFVPDAMFIAPLNLGQPADVSLRLGSPANVAMTLADVAPGSSGDPRVYYVRLFDGNGEQPAWLTRTNPIYGNDVTGVRPGDFPWILGGHDVSTPSREVLDAYHANGFLLDWTLSDLRDAYEAEGILMGAGAEDRMDVPRNPSYRHILEGGLGLFTPAAHSAGYKRLMFMNHGTYQPTSELVRNTADAIRVRLEQAPPESAAPKE